LITMNIEGVIALIARIREKAHNLIIEELSKRGIHSLVPSHGAILDELYREDGLAMKELATRIRRDKSTVTTLVKKLEFLGYVERKADPADGRYWLICLTEKGRTLRPVFEEVSEILISMVFQGFEEGEKEALVSDLWRVYNNL